MIFRFILSFKSEEKTLLRFEKKYGISPYCTIVGYIVVSVGVKGVRVIVCYVHGTMTD